MKLTVHHVYTRHRYVICHIIVIANKKEKRKSNNYLVPSYKKSDNSKIIPRVQIRDAKFHENLFINIKVHAQGNSIVEVTIF